MADVDRPQLLPRSHIGTDRGLMVIARPRLPPVGLDVALLDRIEARETTLIMAVEELEVALHVADGADATRDLAERLAPFTRAHPISSIAVYEDAKRRLVEAPLETDYALLIGDDAVSVAIAEERVHIGAFEISISSLEERAFHAETLRLPSGGQIQAAMALLIVAAEFRPGGRTDLEALARRVAAYEAERLEQ